ncbi:hypothetical protein ACERCG_09575 [Mannheimia sp. E30BD]|uniref:hypothetical protein n=1 Tax=Mannheimia sp. E30BD TaxID=3278708 RepID=UPI00359CC055
MDNDANKNTEGKIRPTDNSGKTVQGIDQVLKYSYNEKGERASLERDNNVDDKFDYREEYTLDANGRWVGKNIDLTNDGTFDRKEIYTKSPSDAYVKTEFYNLVPEGSGTKDILTKIEHYENNANGQRTALRGDMQGDGSIDYVSTYDLDASGRTYKSYAYERDNITVAQVTTYTRDANGDVTRSELTDANGLLLSSTNYERDALGRTVVSRVDSNGDNVVDRKYEYTHDDYGQGILRKEYAYNQPNQTLELSSTTEQTFNSSNYVISNKITAADGSFIANVYERDEYGRIAKGTVTGRSNFSWENTYNPDNTIDIRTEYRLDGTFASKLAYSDYDLNGRASTVHRYNAKDELTQIDSVIRDTQGTQIHTIIDTVSNGIGADRFTFGTVGAGLSFHFTQDLTTWKEEELARLGTSLKQINLAINSISTLTLNAETVAKISEGGLRVVGGTDNNDILNLSGFEKAASSTVRNYDLYTATVDGEALNLYVQNNVDVNIIGG